jgi:biotin carboxyl carrier protein
MKEFKFSIEGKSYEVSIEETGKNMATVDVNGKKYAVNIEKKEKPTFIAAAPRPATSAAAAAPASKSVPGTVTSPLPGSIIKIMVSVGQAVKRGDTLLTMESMKMENNIKAEKDGVVKAILVQQGQSVMQGDSLVDLESVGDPEPAPAPKAAEKKAEAPKAAPAPKPAGAASVAAPLPGSIIKILVKAGAAVKRGDTVLTMESMKMENNIMAERDGVVKTIHVQPGQSVMQGDPLFDLE